MMPTEKHHWSRMKALIRPIVMVAVFITIIFAAIAWPTKMLKDMQDVHQDVVDDNEERCKSIGADLKTIDGGVRSHRHLHVHHTRRNHRRRSRRLSHRQH